MKEEEIDIMARFTGKAILKALTELEIALEEEDEEKLVYYFPFDKDEIFDVNVVAGLKELFGADELRITLNRDDEIDHLLGFYYKKNGEEKK